jgi:predicted dehydrogenase
MNSVEGAKLTAVADANPQRVDKICGTQHCKGFTDAREMMKSGLIDAVLIATPHYSHLEFGQAAFDAGLHVLCEKPIAVTVGQARRFNEIASAHPNLKFGVMFQARTLPAYAKMRDIIQAGELGEIFRITWVVTNWFRSHAYYASGGWRATWAGEGGGVLLNQCPHNLDLLQWITNLMPSRVTAVASVGKTHPIEVEDEVAAILEYSSGAVGHFITTTGEFPGTDRLEIAGDQGKLVAERNKLTFHRTRQKVRETNETTKQQFPRIETWDIDITIDSPPPMPTTHKIITQNFVRAVLKDEPLIAPGTEGVKGLEIGNAIAMAGLTRKPVNLPLDAQAYEKFLAEMTAKYGGRKTVNITEKASALADPLVQTVVR